MGLFGPPDVEKLKAKGDVPGLIQALVYQKDAGIRKAAAYALGQLGNSVAVQPLLRALGDVDEVMAAAAVALVQIGDREAIGRLVEALKSSDRAYREAAAKALALRPGWDSPADRLEVLAERNRSAAESDRLAIERDLSAIQTAGQLRRSHGDWHTDCGALPNYEHTDQHTDEWFPT